VTAAKRPAVLDSVIAQLLPAPAINATPLPELDTQLPTAWQLAAAAHATAVGNTTVPAGTDGATAVHDTPLNVSTNTPRTDAVWYVPTATQLEVDAHDTPVNDPVTAPAGNGNVVAAHAPFHCCAIGAS
jgi:hypothetical protein